jgi:hypothetical protein
MKRINLNLTASGSDKKVTVSGKLYFWERVECIITGLDVKSVSTVRSAIYDGDTQVVSAINFSSAGFNTIYCEYVLQTEELQAALSEVSPNAKKNFTVYIWDEYEEEMISVGTIPIYNNPYIKNESFENIIVKSNIMVQYSDDGGETWSETAPNRTTHIRFSVDGGVNWQDKVLISNGYIDDSDASNSISIENGVDGYYLTVTDSNGIKHKLMVEDLIDLTGPTMTIYNQ